MSRKVQRALVFALVLWILGITAVYAESPVHTDCSDYTEAPVGLFVDIACLPSDAWWPIFTPWEKFLEGEEIDNAISSIFVKEGWSVLVSENPDGSGNTECVTETKWEMNGDKWPGTEVPMGDSVSYIRIFDNSTCAPEEEPEQPQYCDALQFEGVGFYALLSCETPGISITTTVTGVVAGLNWYPNSVYIVEGWSVLVGNGEQESCLIGSKWNLPTDKWEDGSAMTDINFSVAFSDESCGFDQVPSEPEEPVQPKTYCDSYNYRGVGLYDNTSCELPGMVLTTTVSGEIELGLLSREISSIYLNGEFSLLVSDGAQQACISGGSKWNLAVDFWPNGQPQNDSITSAVVFSNTACTDVVAPPPVDEDAVIFIPAIFGPQEKTYCNDRSFEGIALYNQRSCELPGKQAVGQQPGVLEFTFVPLSLYVSEGWSIKVGDGTYTTCVSETKWDLSLDTWPSSISGAKMTNINLAKVYDNPSCTD